MTYAEAAIRSFEGRKHEVIYTLASAANAPSAFGKWPRKKPVAMFLGMHFNNPADAFEEARDKHPEYAKLAGEFAEQLRGDEEPKGQ